MVSVRNDGRLLVLAATAAWVGFVVYLSVLPRLPRVPLVPVDRASPLGHYVIHLVLVSLVYILIVTRSSGIAGRLRSAAVALLLSAALGAGIEALQALLPARSASLDDFLMDIAGGGSGALLMVGASQMGMGQRFLIVPTMLAALGIIGMASASSIVWDPSLPWAGDHWHARYRVQVCGRGLPPFPPAPGPVHPHGKGTIHIHPSGPSSSGTNATLGLFFAISGGELAGDTLRLPSGETYSSGDLCPGGRPGEVVVTVNDVRVAEPGSYVLRNYDRVLIEFRER